MLRVSMRAAAVPFARSLSIPASGRSFSTSPAPAARPLQAAKSFLFVPSFEGLLEKCLSRGWRPDVFVPDLEDSVALAEKPKARTTLVSKLADLAGSGVAVMPRVNAYGTDWFEGDVEAVVSGHIVGISVGKVEGQDEMDHIDAMLSAHESRAGLRQGSLVVVPWVETAKGVVHAYDIAKAPRVLGLAFGADDFLTSMQVERDKHGGEAGDMPLVDHARLAIAVAARAANVNALETPFVDFKSDEGLIAATNHAKGMGYKGMFAIHPSQVDGINAVFQPSEEEIAYATRVVQAFSQAEQEGRGSTSLDGKMIDVPHVRRAKSLLIRAGLPLEGL